MTRLAKKPIMIPSGVKVTYKEHAVHVEGAKGQLAQGLLERVQVEIKGQEVYVRRQGNTVREKACHGTMYRLIENMIKGVTVGYKRDLKIEGVGFKAEVKGKNLVMNLGFSHPVELPIPDGISVKVNKATEINLEGISKASVGQFAAKTRSAYEPEPYKGKGVRYVGEQVRRKAGKAVGK